MSEVILLSSDEEENVSPSKKPKIDSNNKSYDCIVLSDDEDGSSPETIKISPTEGERPFLSELLLDEKEEKEENEEEKLFNESLTPSLEEKEVIINDLEDKQSLNEPACESIENNDCEKEELSESCTAFEQEINDCKEESEPSSSSKTLEEIVTEFIDLCLKFESNEEYRQVMNKKGSDLKATAKEIEEKCTNLNELVNLIKENQEKVEKNSKNILIYFRNVYKELKSTYKMIKVDLNPKKFKIVRQMEETLTKLTKKIKRLEEAEVNWDEEENSSYIQMQRYRERAAQIYEKYCRYTNQDPHKGQILYSRLDFTGSKHIKINWAISKHFKNKDMFPTYEVIETLIKKCVEEHNINLSKTEIVDEAKHCLKVLGKLLQKRRRLDLNTIHSSYLENLVLDPAKDDPELESKLKESEKIREIKISEICEKYAKLQEQNPELIDTDNSTDSDKEENGNKTDHEVVI